jgi:hypothetical protein
MEEVAEKERVKDIDVSGTWVGIEKFFELH